MRLVYITLARKILCYGSFPAKVLLGTNAYNSHKYIDNNSMHTYRRLKPTAIYGPMHGIEPGLPIRRGGGWT